MTNRRVQFKEISNKGWCIQYALYINGYFHSVVYRMADNG